MRDPVLGMLGLCARARKLITGEKAVVQAVRAGSCYAAVLDGAAAKNAVKAVSQACKSHGIPLVRTQPLQLGDAIGKPGRMAAAVTDERMAAAVTDERMAGRIVELSRPSGGAQPLE